MKKLSVYFALSAFLILTITCRNNDNKNNSKEMENITLSVDTVIKALTDKYGKDNKIKIEKGVKQMAPLWTEKDGDAKEFKKFCITNFVKPGDEQKILFDRLSTDFEVLIGHFNKVSLDLKISLHLDKGDILPIDEIFGGYDPSAHFTEDFFQNKIAFIVILNFPFYTLKEKEELGPSWSRLEWAYAKMGDLFTSRVPAELIQNFSDALTASDTYIALYNIYVGKLVNDKMKTFFPADLKLITHWGLRDELKSHYADKDGLEKQKMIYEVMKKIVSQEIPTEVINKNDYQWNPSTNKLYKDSKEVSGTPEKNTRYQYFLTNFKTASAIDKYNPQFPTYIQRKFDGEMQLTQEEVEKLFIDFISSPTVKNVATLISTRLNRKLQPFDIWYDGFKSRSAIS